MELSYTRKSRYVRVEQSIRNDNCPWRIITAGIAVSIISKTIYDVKSRKLIPNPYRLAGQKIKHIAYRSSDKAFGSEEEAIIWCHLNNFIIVRTKLDQIRLVRKEKWYHNIIFKYYKEYETIPYLHESEDRLQISKSK